MPRSHKTRTEWLIDRYGRFFFTKDKTEGEWEQYDDSQAPLVVTLTELHDLVITQDTTVLESFHLPNSKDYIRGMARDDNLLVLYKCQGNARRFRIRFKPVEEKSGQAVCEDCMAKLSNYFFIKKGSPRSQDTTNKSGGGDDATTGAKTAVGPPQCHDRKSKDASCGRRPAVNHAWHAELSRETLSPKASPSKERQKKPRTKPSKEPFLSPHVPDGTERNNNMVMTSNVGATPQSHTSLDVPPEDLHHDIPRLLGQCLSDPGFPAFVESVEKALGELVKTSTTLPEAMMIE